MQYWQHDFGAIQYYMVSCHNIGRYFVDIDPILRGHDGPC
jgi:hypothetical protein